MIDRLARPVAWALLIITTITTAWDLVAIAHGREVSYLSSAGVDAMWALGFFAFGVVATVILTRLPRHRIGWLFMATAVLMSVELWLARLGQNAIEVDRLPFDARLAWVTNWLWLPPLILLTVHLPLYFPDGDAPSPRWRAVGWLGAFALAASVVTAALRVGPLDTPFPEVVNPFGVAPFDATTQTISELPWFASAIAAIWATAVRFRRAAGVERQQIKWLLVSLVPGLGLIVVSVLWAATGGAPGQIPYLALLIVPVWTAAVAIASALAIFRYHLYDIDVVINRALVYGATTVAIAVAFFGGIVMLQALLRPITNGSELAVAASTLASLGLFQPLRRRIQKAVDRRFYRSRYDAARTLDDFSARLRDEVDLDAVRADLVSAVRDTVQPAHASVWLRR